MVALGDRGGSPYGILEVNSEEKIVGATFIGRPYVSGGAWILNSGQFC